MTIIKIALWIALLPILMYLTGWWGILLYAVICFGWNIGFSVYKGVRFKTVFADPTRPFTIYGHYCSPRYGEQHLDRHPIDALDNACRSHDIEMDEIDGADLSNQEHVRRKNRADWQLAKAAVSEKHSATGAYVLGLAVGMLLRMFGRRF